MLLVVAILGGIYLSLGVVLFLAQRAFVFPAPPKVVPKPGRATLLTEPVVALWRPPDPGAPTLVYFHGNAAQLSDLPTWFADEIDRVGFFAIEYPGYGMNPGVPTEEAIYAAAEAGLEHLTGPLGIPRENVILVGQSLGTGVAVEMASRGWGRAMVLLTPYTSMPDVAAGIFPWLPVRWMMRDRFESERKAATVKIPVLVIHGTADSVVPYAQGAQLAKAFPRGALLTIEQGTHFDLWNRPQVMQAVLEAANQRQ